MSLDMADRRESWQIRRRVDGSPRLVYSWLDAHAAEDRARWDALILRCRHDFHQLPEYVALEARRLGGHGMALVVSDTGDHARGCTREALLPLVLRPVPTRSAGDAWSVDAQDATSPYGYPCPVFSDPDPRFMAASVQTFVAGMRARKVVAAFVRLHPLLDVPEQAMAEAGTIVEHGPTVWIDLTADEATQWAGYRATHRNLIRRATREGLRVSFDDAFARLDEFFGVYAQTMERLDADWAEFGREYLEQLAAMLRARGLGFLALVEHEGEVIAGGVFTSCSGIVQYHLSGTANAWQQASPSRLMLDEVRRRQVARGDRQMHLGGGVGAREDALFRFKRGFSPERGRFLSWRVIPDPDVHARLVDAWVARGGSRELAGRFFPLYRAPVHPPPNPSEDPRA
jgi:hypothetical protein